MRKLALDDKRVGVETVQKMTDADNDEQYKPIVSI